MLVFLAFNLYVAPDEVGRLMGLICSGGDAGFAVQMTAICFNVGGGASVFWLLTRQ